jgi:tetrahydromethanopterin S-methyltransferase subunit B
MCNDVIYSSAACLTSSVNKASNLALPISGDTSTGTNADEDEDEKAEETEIEEDIEELTEALAPEEVTALDPSPPLLQPTRANAPINNTVLNFLIVSIHLNILSYLFILILPKFTLKY